MVLLGFAERCCNILTVSGSASPSRFQIVAIGLSIRIVRYHIEKLRKKNVISREGSKKAGRWVVNI